jgi:glycosyltransferase involved in cell wall biosynthesis
LESLAHTLGIANRVHFAGMVVDLKPFWERADIFLHGSVRPEPFGRVVAEAMRAGVPPIAPDCGGITELVRDEIDGLLYPMGNFLALRNAIVRLAEALETRLRMGEAASIRIATDFSADQTLSEIEAILSGTHAQGAGHDGDQERG